MEGLLVSWIPNNADALICNPQIALTSYTDITLEVWCTKRVN